MKPVYPALAQRERATGTVVLETVVQANGQVGCARVVRSVPMLDQAATDAVTQWEFTPTIVDGKPVAIYMTTTVNFSLR